jgi:hypothetical protein
MTAKILMFSDSKTNEAKAWEAHEAEANRRGAEFYNCGWATGDYGGCFEIT